ncbi:hypothetical protein A2685_00140 [Candidatus Woesebacteria bacterium RIFCSPHIGHO2_01_FULL_37_10]|uniref:Uncharacterized protein n=1 Tax=Candidatus Woesebacteria bacterium RIFCSPHIGHO2_01_FULL_37_10 TaxID=1802489 RepID=A0A1F7XZ48_9BACT|nr:MAG: hypothetical protein A2685_00140 [Candidatus Woesebacteria bacterium RIFCSPHIGHO2_01_FULL_37_10]
MIYLNKKIATAFAAGALLLNTVAPVFAGTTIILSENGDGSDNDATVKLGQSTTVVQSNNADVYNNVDAEAETGDNEANENTGGDVDIETGDASVDVNVENTLNSNSAEVDCCPSGDIDVLINGNGSDTDNTVDLKLGTETELYQNNYAEVKNIVDAEAETGDNEAEENTGGSVSIKTGNASTTVGLSTTANANSAKIGGDGQGGSLSAIISENGDESDNDIDLVLGSLVLLAQSNVADVFNKVDAEAETGDNEAEENTGGEVEIETGDAEVDVTVDNMVNFNWADLECGCLLDDLFVKIWGNGSDTDNTIDAELGQETLAFQGNCAEDNQLPGDVSSYGGEGECELDNFVDAEAETGDNEAEENTEGDGHDPSVSTGEADVEVDLENSGNVNVLGDGFELPFDEVDFGFNWAFFAAWFSWLAS